MTGIETIEEMRNRGYDDRILLFSTHDMKDLEKDNNYLGIDKFLSKDDIEGLVKYLGSLKKLWL
jgi:hypothetical protein